MRLFSLLALVLSVLPTRADEAIHETFYRNFSHGENTYIEVRYQFDQDVFVLRDFHFSFSDDGSVTGLPLSAYYGFKDIEVVLEGSPQMPHQATSAVGFAQVKTRVIELIFLDDHKFTLTVSPDGHMNGFFNMGPVQGGQLFLMNPERPEGLGISNSKKHPYVHVMGLGRFKIQSYMEADLFGYLRRALAGQRHQDLRRSDAHIPKCKEALTTGLLVIDGGKR